MKSEQREFLRKRLRAGVQAQPEFAQLVRVLLKLGGEMVVTPPVRDDDALELIRNGFVQAGPVVLKVGVASACHQNVAALWRKARRGGMVGIGTGYGLTGDGLWRQHSWGILREGILETTVARTKYFGICLQGQRADGFC